MLHSKIIKQIKHFIVRKGYQSICDFTKVAIVIFFKNILTKRQRGNMTKLRKPMLTSACALLASTGIAMAGSSDFGGLYVGVQGSVNGIELDGKHTDGTNAAITKGTAGAIAEVAGFEAGWNIPMGDSFFLGVGAMWIPIDASFAANDAADGADVTLTTSNHFTYYIQPSISVMDNTAIYLKYGISEGDLKATGDVTGQPNNLEGTTVAIGTTTLFGSGIFMRTEAGKHTYDHIKLTGVGGTATSILEGDPTVAFGAVSLGFQF